MLNSKRWTEDSFFERARNESGEKATSALRTLYDDARDMGFEVVWGSGPRLPRFMIRPGDRDDGVSGWADGTIQVAWKKLSGLAIPTVNHALQGLSDVLGTPTVTAFEAIRVLKPEVRAALRNLLEVLSTNALGPSSTRDFGAKYRPAREDMVFVEGDPWASDPEKIERGSRGHAITQNAIAEFLLAHGVEPRSPTLSEPEYDLGWEDGGTRFVAEIKSITDANEEKQLRLGLGQILRYRSRLGGGPSVVAVLVSERPPRDETWLNTCDENDVILVWPGFFDRCLRK